MHGILLVLIVGIGALGFAKRIPTNLASWIVVGLTILGIFTIADVSMRLMFVGAAMLGPLVLYSLQLVFSLTVRPFLHYVRWSSDAHRSMFNVDSPDPLYMAVDEQIDPHVQSLLSSGFVSRGRVGNRVGENTVVIEFCERGNGTEWAIISATLPASVQPVILLCSCSFADDRTIAVNNYPWVDPNPPSPGNEMTRLPSLGDINDLVRACLTIATRSSHGPIVATPLVTDMATMVRERTKRRQDAEVGAGYLRYDASSDVYRSTLRNAYRMFWVSLPPLKWIIERRDLARERELLAEMRLTPTPRSDTKLGEEGATPQPTRRQYVRNVALVAALIVFIVFIPDLPGMIFPGRSHALVKPAINVPGDFVVPDSFPGAVRALERLVGRPSHQLVGNRDDEPTPTLGVAISMRQDSADVYVAAAHTAFLDEGFYLFRTGERATSGLETDALALYPTLDPYVIMRAMETNAWNHGMSTDDVIAWFRREETRYPIQFEAIAFDYVGGRLLGPTVPDETDFARRFIRFCPDIREEGPVSARSLGRDFKRTREIFCWWD